MGSGNNRRANLKNWWTGLQIHQDRTLSEKMLMFYQTLLVTQDAVLENANSMYLTQNLYRQNVLVITSSWSKKLLWIREC